MAIERIRESDEASRRETSSPETSFDGEVRDGENIEVPFEGRI